MALDNEAVVTPAIGYIYTADPGTENPTALEIEDFDPEVGFVSWDDLGHTSRDELPEFGFEGGDTEVRGTWQNASLKTVVTEPPVDSVVFRLHQLNAGGFSLYYGGEASAVDGEFVVQDTPMTAVKKALLIVIKDGDTSIAFYAPNTDIRREEAIGMEVDGFMTLPLRATFLKVPGSPLYKWISNDTMAAGS